MNEQKKQLLEVIWDNDRDDWWSVAKEASELEEKE